MGCIEPRDAELRGEPNRPSFDSRSALHTIHLGSETGVVVLVSPTSRVTEVLDGGRSIRCNEMLCELGCVGLPDRVRR